MKYSAVSLIVLAILIAGCLDKNKNTQDSSEQIQSDSQTGQTASGQKTENTEEKIGWFDWLKSDKQQNDTPEPEKPWFGQDTETKAAVAEIEQAAKLYFEKDRAELLESIAARNDLPIDAQTYLVKVAFSNLEEFENRQKVLLELIASSGFSNKAKMKILENLENSNSDQLRYAVLKALSEKE
jgi:hypothetical protein